jgi:hypothetical protein
VYTHTVSLPGKSGVIGIQLPAAKAAQLKLEQPYQWTFSVLCNSDNPSINPTVFGLVKRVDYIPGSAKTESTVNIQKQLTTVYDRTQAYAKDGIWVVPFRKG